MTKIDYQNSKRFISSVGLALLIISLASLTGCGGSKHHDDDQISPTTSITAPAADTLLRGIVTISADAQDNVAVSAVKFHIDDQLLVTDTSSPYSYDWDTRLVNDGVHAIKVIAADAAGNTAESGISVSVDNTAPGDWHPGLSAVFGGKRSSQADAASGGNEGPWNAHFNSGGVIVCNDC